ncbi:MAG: hypothetical protein DWQ29_08610 [Planctomycetota bacterium]|nr:MAG: hypothetical protein DWQ29_08610 [Planctomycetota bacterium]
MTDSSRTSLAAPWKTPCLIAGLVGAAVCAAGALIQPGQFWPGYLTAFVFWLGVGLGSLGIALLHRLTGGRWGWSVSRPLVAGAETIPVLFLLSLPLALSLPTLYAFGGDDSHSSLNAQQELYFLLPFFFGRAALYFVVWNILSFGVSRAYKRDREHGVTGGGARRAALGLIVFWLLASFAVFDWIMSVDPGWYSTIYGAQHTMGFAVSAFAFAIIVRHFSGRAASEPDARTQDLGSMLLAFNLLWVYFAFSQFFLIWSADLPIENTWYLRRSEGLWAAAAPTLAVVHFVVPFALLLSQDVKAHSRRLAGVAALLLAARLIDLTWCIVPACDVAGAMTAVYGLAAFIALGGLWLFVFRLRWEKLAILADPVMLPSAKRDSADSLEAV